MRKIKRRRRCAAAWRGILERFAARGVAPATFCAQEGIDVQSLRRWRARLGGDAGGASVAPVLEDNSKPAAGFIDLGEVRAGGSHLEVRLELGAGLVLSIARG